MTSRIEATFEKTKVEKRAALVTYIMGYDPDLETCESLLQQLPEAGADIIELGMPFSDPMADGPTIQLAANRAIEAGATTRKVLDMVAGFRKKNTTTPIILMGYYNPIYHYGLDKFVKEAVEAGVDGMIIVDLPPEEEEEFVSIAEPAGLALIKLTAPTTTPERAEKVLQHASGFVYYISVAGITGAKSANIKDTEAMLMQLRQSTDLPIAVGFGIKTPEQAKDVAQMADAVVVGSAFVQLAGEGKTDEILELCRNMAQKLEK